MSLAPLSNRLFMIQREIPAYLSAAHEMRFPTRRWNEYTPIKVARLFKEYVHLIVEMMISMFFQDRDSLDKNAQKLEIFFDVTGTTNAKRSKKPICAYIVVGNDDNGAILGKHACYYHAYKIKVLGEHYTVVPKVVKKKSEMFNFLNDLKRTYLDREIQVVDIVANGSAAYIELRNGDNPIDDYELQNVGDDEFKDCAKEAVIILDTGSAGAGKHSIAAKIAHKNPGKTVFAPGTDLFFSKPIFVEKNGKGFIDNVVHGFALFSAYTARRFRFTAIPNRAALNSHA